MTSWMPLRFENLQLCDALSEASCKSFNVLEAKKLNKIKAKLQTLISGCFFLLKTVAAVKLAVFLFCMSLYKLNTYVHHIRVLHCTI